MAHPKSTITNIFFMAAGLVFAFIGGPVLQVVSGGAVILLGVASGGYHWTASRWWNRADIIMIYVTFFVMMAWQLSTFEGFYDSRWQLLAVALGLSLFVGLTYDRWTHMQIGLLAIMNIVILSIRVEPWQVIMASVAYVFGYWIGVEAETYKKSQFGYDALHAVRHVLWAIAIFATIL